MLKNVKIRYNACNLQIFGIFAFPALLIQGALIKIELPFSVERLTFGEFFNHKFLGESR